jgi:hypothetical protein
MATLCARILSLRAGYMYDAKGSGHILGGETVTSSRVGHTGARTTLADAYASYHKVHGPSGLAPATVSGYKTRPRAAPSPIHRFTTKASNCSFGRRPKSGRPAPGWYTVGESEQRFGENASSGPAKGPKADEISYL